MYILNFDLWIRLKMLNISKILHFYFNDFYWYYCSFVLLFFNFYFNDFYWYYAVLFCYFLTCLQSVSCLSRFFVCLENFWQAFDILRPHIGEMSPRIFSKQNNNKNKNIWKNQKSYQFWAHLLAMESYWHPLTSQNVNLSDNILNNNF